jgi:hypothetical protein
MTMTNEKEIPMSDELAVQQVLARYSRAQIGATAPP